MSIHTCLFSYFFGKRQIRSRVNKKKFSHAATTVLFNIIALVALTNFPKPYLARHVEIPTPIPAEAPVTRITLSELDSEEEDILRCCKKICKVPMTQSSNGRTTVISHGIQPCFSVPSSPVLVKQQQQQNLRQATTVPQ